MALAAAGYRDAFELLVRRHLPPITNYCAKLVGNPRTGEELAQEVLLELWLQRQRYRESGRLAVFLYTLARNRCLNQLRSERRRRLFGLRAAAAPPERELPEATSATPDQLDRILEAERCSAVRRALLELPLKLREAVLLRFDQGLDYAAISRIIGRPEGTARSRVHLALRQLRDRAAGGDAGGGDR
jgi:RNA polymerase sigma-70 factor (ECF subfamily)